MLASCQRDPSSNRQELRISHILDWNACGKVFMTIAMYNMTIWWGILFFLVYLHQSCSATSLQIHGSLFFCFINLKIGSTFPSAFQLFPNQPNMDPNKEELRIFLSFLSCHCANNILRSSFDLRLELQMVCHNLWLCIFNHKLVLDISWKHQASFSFFFV